MAEKRKKGRVRKRLKVRFGVDRPERMAFAKDLSERGIQISTNSVLPPGTTLQIELTFPDRTFTLWARVAWAKQVPHRLAHTLPCGMGLDFLEPDPEWQAYFHETVQPG